MKYQIADAFTGPFGDIYDTLEEAEKALIHENEACQKKLEAQYDWWEPYGENYFVIVEVEDK